MYSDSGPKISILMCSRSTNNSRKLLFENFLHSLLKNTYNLSSIEIFVKLDEDDPRLNDYIKLIQKNKHELSITHIITPRGKGYEDLHLAYNLFLRDYVSPSSKLYFLPSDDVKFILKNWDKICIDIAEKNNNCVFTINSLVGRTIPPSRTLRKFIKKILCWPIHRHSIRDFIDAPDPYKLYSKKLIEIAGDFGNSTFNDAWFESIEYTLQSEYSISIFKKLDKPIVLREMNSEDLPGSMRFDIVRKKLHDELLSERYTVLRKKIAQKIAMHYKGKHS